jgi:hypothetical protein
MEFRIDTRGGRDNCLLTVMQNDNLIICSFHLSYDDLSKLADELRAEGF